MFRVDLHTHSSASPDGGITAEAYRAALREGRLQAIAITDHDRIDMAEKLHRELGDAIIIGEEIKAREGEVIGLYLTRRIAPGQSAADTAAAIKAQGGLIYIPHPFETVRSGIDEATLESIAGMVDIIEVHNGRAVFQNRSALARRYQTRYDWAGAASSDAHTAAGWGRTYTTLGAMPGRDTLCALLASAKYTVRHPGVRGLTAPKLNRLRKRLRRV